MVVSADSQPNTQRMSSQATAGMPGAYHPTRPTTSSLSTYPGRPRDFWTEAPRQLEVPLPLTHAQETFDAQCTDLGSSRRWTGRTDSSRAYSNSSSPERRSEQHPRPFHEPDLPPMDLDSDSFPDTDTESPIFTDWSDEESSDAGNKMADVVAPSGSIKPPPPLFSPGSEYSSASQYAAKAAQAKDRGAGQFKRSNDGYSSQALGPRLCKICDLKPAYSKYGKSYPTCGFTCAAKLKEKERASRPSSLCVVSTGYFK
ncbi:hypothetical protein DFP72DRAFT_862717 [Ephemerocybe angulata]|uniref:Uncharacterized protein n=1 Tax=Ephemerocybe angulata TaxID=980116 RepID=A0A8H6H861_9AGAR|nr:hypothetical protein DFP72DRAFT_862717 [Tulosesus angulatus]